MMNHSDTLEEDNKLLQSTEVSENQNNINVDIGEDVTKSVFQVEGLSCCASCSKTVEEGIERSNGVKQAKFYFVSEKVEIIYDKMLTTEEELIEKFKSLGHKAYILAEDSSSQITFIIKSKDKIGAVEKLLKQEKGVSKVDVKFEASNYKVHVNFDPNVTGCRTLFNFLQTIDSQTSIFSTNTMKTQSRGTEIQLWKKCFLLSLFFTIAIFVLSIIAPLIAPVHEILSFELFRRITVKIVLELLLTTPVQFLFAFPIYKSAFLSLKNIKLNMDVLIILSTLSAYLYSIISILFTIFVPSYNGDFYFETAAFLLTAVMFGRFLEILAIKSTSNALQKLHTLQTPTAILIEDNQEKEIDINLLQRNDIVKVQPGGKIPSDGIVIQGSTLVNESMITGESVSVAKNVNDTVIGGTINETGMIHIKISKTQSENILSSIYKLVEEAQASKTSVQRIADTIAQYFIPVILIISILTFIIWFIVAWFNILPEKFRNDSLGSFPFAMMFAMTVLVISCPCAISLSAPTAIMVATGLAAKLGILFKGGTAIENAHKITTIVFDKTGTLTQGKPNVTDCIMLKEDWSEKEFLYFVASAEKGFIKHVLGQAIIDYSTSKYSDLFLQEPMNFESVAGFGLRCTVDHFTIVVGKYDWIRQNNITIMNEETITNQIETLEKEAKTVVCAAIDNELIGIIALADILKEEANSVVSYLQNRLHIKVWMISGDNNHTAQSIASQIGIKNVMAQVLPNQKADKIKELQLSGEKVAMVGDGINDAPALSQADIGIAVGSGTEIAIESSSIVLLKNNLADVLIALALSRTTFTRIKLNFVWAFLYNLIGIPFAAGALFPFIGWSLPPSIAGLSEILSSIPVILFSLLLKFYKPPKINSQN